MRSLSNEPICVCITTGQIQISEEYLKGWLCYKYVPSEDSSYWKNHRKEPFLCSYLMRKNLGEERKEEFPNLYPHLKGKIETFDKMLWHASK